MNGLFLHIASNPADIMERDKTVLAMLEGRLLNNGYLEMHSISNA